MSVTLSRGQIRNCANAPGNLYLRTTALSSQLTLDLHVQPSASICFYRRALGYASSEGNSDLEQGPLQSEPNVPF